MSLFRRKNKFTISERDPTYKVQYLGNVQTSLMKGEGCVDKPIGVLWNNYQKNGQTAINMKLIVGATGLKVMTKDQGLTEYRANKVSYCIAHPEYPKVFVWVYRHEGKRLKVELRCHAVLAKTDAQAKAMAVQLHDKLTLALSDFLRLKTRRQNARLALQRTYSLPSSGSKLSPGSLPSPGSGVSGIPARSMFLTTGQNFKASIDKSSSAPKLGAITESIDEDETPTVLLEEDSSLDVFEFEVGNDIAALKDDVLVRKQLAKDINGALDGEGDSVEENDSTSGSGSTSSDAESRYPQVEEINSQDEFPVSNYPNAQDQISLL